MQKFNFSWLREYRWQIVAIILFGSIINYIDRVNLSFATTDLRAEFGLNASQLGFLLAAWMWPYAAASIPSGWLIDKLGINRIFIYSVILWSIATIGSGISNTYWELYLSRVCLGIAEAPFFIISAKVVQLYFNAQKKGLAAGVINLGPKLANAFAPPIIATLILTTSWRGMFMILGIIGFLIVLLWSKTYKTDKAISQTKTLNTKKQINFWKLLNHQTTWWINLGNFGSSYVFWLYFTWLPTYLIDKRHLNLATTGWIAALPFIFGAIAVPLGGYFSDFLMARYKINNIRARVIPAAIGCIIAGITVIPINYITDLYTTVILFSVSTCAVSARVGVLWALVSDIAPQNAVGIFGGLQNCTSFIGGALAPILSGIIIQFTYNYNIVFAISGILVILAALCYFMVSKPILIEEI